MGSISKFLNQYGLSIILRLLNNFDNIFCVTLEGIDNILIKPSCYFGLAVVFTQDSCINV